VSEKTVLIPCLIFLFAFFLLTFYFTSVSSVSSVAKNKFSVAESAYRNRKYKIENASVCYQLCNPGFLSRPDLLYKCLKPRRQRNVLLAVEAEVENRHLVAVSA